MKVRVMVTCTAVYMGELEMTEAEHDRRCNEQDAARGHQADTLAHDLIEEIGLDLADPTDWGTCEIESFDIVQTKPKKSKASLAT